MQIENIKTSFYYLITFAILNIAFSFMLFYLKGANALIGYLGGTLLSVLLSVFWFIGIMKAVRADNLKLLKIVLWGFLARFTFLLVFVLATILIFQFSVLYFVFSFLFGTIVGLIIEIRFIKSLNLTAIRETQNSTTAPKM